jgi:hypothetical protein
MEDDPMLEFIADNYSLIFIVAVLGLVASSWGYRRQ